MAEENQSHHIPALVRDSPSLAESIANSVAYGMMPPTTEIKPLEGGRKTRIRFRNADSFDAAEELVGRWGEDKVAVLNMWADLSCSCKKLGI